MSKESSTLKYNNEIKEILTKLNLIPVSEPQEYGTYLHVWTYYNQNAKSRGGHGTVTINLSKCVLGQKVINTAKAKLFKKNSLIGVDKVVRLDSLYEYNNSLEDTRHVY